MKHFAVIFSAGFAFVATLSAAQAQNARSFVSGHGLDTNACTIIAPCRTFAVAFTHTNPGGEIDVLDTAGYGALTITHAISIVNDGAVASVLAPSSGTGITINAGPNDAVSLRGLTIEGAGAGHYGIVFNTGQSLTVTNSVIRHFIFNGIDYLPNAASNLSVSSTLVADNGDTGIRVLPSGAGDVTVVLNRVDVNNNSGDGIRMNGANSTGTINATVSESVVAGSGNVGIVSISSASHAPTNLMLFHSIAVNNGTGFVANGTGATLRAAQSTVTGNVNGWQTFNAGVVLSAGDNTIEGNASNETAPAVYTRK